MPGNMDSLNSVGCGVVSKHGLPRETWTEKHVSDDVKKEDAGNMKNCVGKTVESLQKKGVENEAENVSVEPINLDMLEVEL